MRVGIVGCGNVAGNRAAAFAGLSAAKSLAVLTALYTSAKSGRPERVPSLKEITP
jgi:UDP-N-acetyl-2-amino-2-deoxyglucuronate dehydrogenase